MPKIPKGTLIQKTRRQWTSASDPPATRPTKVPATQAMLLIPMAMPRWWAGKASVTMAVELAISSAPPIPWTTRMTMSSTAPAAPAPGVSERAIEARVKMANPALYIRTRPNMSPMRPNVTTSTVVTTR